MPRKSGPRPTHVTITRHELPDGTRCRADTPGALRRKTRSETYYAFLPGRHRVNLRTADLSEAWAELHKVLRREADKKAGILDDFHLYAEQPLTSHLESFIADLRASGETEERQANQIAGRLRTFFCLANWSLLGHLTASSALEALARMQKDPARGRGGRGISAQTRNHYRSHLRQFARWCVRTGRLRANPLESINPVNVETDRRHDRRSPTDEEIAQLLAELDRAEAPVRAGMTARQRSLGYRLCMATGFRAGELRSLRVGNFDLEAGTVTASASFSKRRRRDTQQLPPWLTQELRDWFAAGGGTWENFPARWPGQLLQEDLARAGVPYERDGLFFDFHSLRHWYVSWAANQPGISPKTLMELARHSDPKLTLKIYAKARADEERAAVECLPRLAAPPQAPPAATGGPEKPG